MIELRALQPGMHVRIAPREILEKYKHEGPGCLREMMEYAGQMLTIREVRQRTVVLEEPGRYYWSPLYIESIEECNPSMDTLRGLLKGEMS